MNFLMAILLIVALYAFYLTYPLYHAIEIADVQVKEAVAFEQHPSDPKMRILVAGDSSAVGVGVKDPKDSIAGRIGQQFPNADLINLGVSGATVNDLLETLKKQKGNHYDLMLLQIGANDVTHFVPNSTIRKNIAEVLNLSNQLASKTILITSGDAGQIPIFRWPLNAIMTMRSRQARDIFVEETAKVKNATFVDLFYELKKDPAAQDFKDFYSPDSFHLNGAGYGIYYNHVKKVL